MRKTAERFNYRGISIQEAVRIDGVLFWFNSLHFKKNLAEQHAIWVRKQNRNARVIPGVRKGRKYYKVYSKFK